MSAALTAHEESLCDGCGQPKDRAHGDEGEGWHEVRKVTCDGCAAIGEGRGPDGTSSTDLGPGQKVYVVDTRESAGDAGDQPHDHDHDAADDPNEAEE